MSYMSDMIKITRGLIADLVEPYLYSDERLEDILVISAVLVMEDVGISGYIIDLSANTIVPDPSNEFQALICLYAACMLSRGQHRTASGQAMNVKDGPSTIDTRDRAKHLGELAGDACESYDSAKINYQVGDGSVGKAIVTPYGIGLSDTPFN